MPISPHKTVSTLGDARSDYTSFYTWDSAVDEHPDYLNIAIVSPLPHLEQEYQGFQTHLQLTDLESVVLITSGHRLIASKLGDDFRTYAGDPASFAEDRLQRTTVLPERIQEVLESVPGILTPQRSERLIELARSCLTDEQYESAVTFAHTALELATSELIISLITFNKLAPQQNRWVI